MSPSRKDNRTPIKKRAVIFLGAPGCGKGTQSQLLADTFDLYLLDTSKILERKFHTDKGDEFLVVDGKRYYVKHERKIWKEGKLCSPPFVAQVLRQAVKKLFEKGEDIVFSGSPRTLYEAERIIPFLISLYGKKNIHVVFLNLSVQESIRRNSNRKICTLMRHSILHHKEMEKLSICPLDGSKLVRRKSLDDPETIKVRWKEFRERTLPVLGFLKRSGVPVHTMSGSKTPDIVFRSVVCALKMKR
jgi:adenylate kinase